MAKLSAEALLSPLSGVDIKNSALVLIDHQVGTLETAGSVNAEQRDQIRMWTRFIVRFAKDAGIPALLTTSLESEAQGPPLPELKEILPKEYAGRIQRVGVVNAWDEQAFVAAIRATGKQTLIMGGITTDVCVVPPALSAGGAGYRVIVLLDISAASTLSAQENSIHLLRSNGVVTMTTIPLITGLLGNYKNPAAAAFYNAIASEETMMPRLNQGLVR